MDSQVIHKSIGENPAIGFSPVPALAAALTLRRRLPRRLLAPRVQPSQPWLRADEDARSLIHDGITLARSNHESPRGFHASYWNP
jgi:hypothetical protein